MSTDNGKNWEITEFETEKFFPIKIVSSPHETLQVLTNDNKIFKLTGNNLVKNWSFVTSILNEENPNHSVAYKGYKILVNGSLLKWQSPIKWDTLLTLNRVSIPFDMLSKDDTIYIAAGGDGGYNAYFVSLTNDSIIKEFPMKGAQALGVRLDNKGRIWTFGDGGIFLKFSNSLSKVY